MALWSEKLEKPEIRLPETVRPSGAGYMPLYCAAQWIATAGGAKKFHPLDVSVWESAYSDLLARLASEEIKVIGFREGMREPIPGYHFASCAVDYPFQDADFDLILSNELHLRSYPYLDEEHWRRGFDDALVDRRGHRWRRLMVLKSDVARFWPFGAAAPLRTGAPAGRRRCSLSRVSSSAALQTNCSRNRSQSKQGCWKVGFARLTPHNPERQRPLSRITSGAHSDASKAWKIKNPGDF
jgi:hypothetical protein